MNQTRRKIVKVGLCTVGIATVAFVLIASSSHAASIVGSVVFRGEIPSAQEVRIKKDAEFCGETRTIQPLHVHPKTKGVKGVVINFLVDAQANLIRMEINQDAAERAGLTIRAPLLGLKVVTLRLPNLTERSVDIPVLIDHFIKRELRCKGFVRYVDDLLLFHDDKGTLWDWTQRIALRMARQRLTLHPGAHPRPVTEGIPFLGFVIYPEKRRLKRRKGIYYQRRLSQLREAYGKGEIELEEMSASVRGWANHVRYGNTIGLRKTLFSQPIPPMQ